MLPTTTRSPSPGVSSGQSLQPATRAQIDPFMSDLLEELQQIKTDHHGAVGLSHPLTVEPSTPEPGLSAPVDLQTLVEERNRLMGQGIALSAEIPPDSDLSGIGRTLRALQGIQSRLTALDASITSLLSPADTSDTAMLKDLQASSADLEQAVRLFEIAELEGRLRSLGTTFEPGHLGVIRHDDSVGLFPAQDVIGLARLHAADGTPAGASIASHLVTSCARGISWPPRDDQKVLLGECTRLAEQLQPRLSQTEQNDLLSTESLALSMGQGHIATVLGDFNLTSMECLDRITSHPMARLCLMQELLDQSEAWTPTPFNLAQHLHAAMVSDVGVPGEWAARLADRVGQRLADGATPAENRHRSSGDLGEADLENMLHSHSAASRKQLAICGLYRLYPSTHPHRLERESERNIAAYEQYRVVTESAAQMNRFRDALKRQLQRLT